MEKPGISGRQNFSLVGLLGMSGSFSFPKSLLNREHGPVSSKADIEKASLKFSLPGESKNPRRLFFILKPFLLCFIIIVLASPVLFSYSGPDEPLSVIINSEPVTPVVGSEWKVLLWVDHPRANEVLVRIPVFPEEYIRLDRVITEPRVMSSGNNAGETWTLVEFFFIPLKAGQLVLQPFEVRIPGKSTTTSQMVFRIGMPQGIQVYHPELRWELVPESIPAGQTRELLLVMQNRDPRKPLGSSLHITLDIPGQAIMERVPLTSWDNLRGGVLRVKVTPLETGILSVSPIMVEYEGISLQSPALRIRITPGSGTRSPPEYRLSREELDYRMSEDDPAVPGQESRTSSYTGIFLGPLKQQYDEVIRRTEELWNRGEKVLAIAELRKAERDLTIGYALRPVRKDLEQTLGLGIMEDEKRLPVKLYWTLCFASLIVSLIIFLYLFFFRKKKNKSAPVSFAQTLGYIILIVLVIGAVIWGIYGTVGVLRSSGKEFPGQAIFYNTDAYRVPELSGGVSGRFKEGQTGVIRAATEGWVYVETSDGKAGWIPRDRAVRY